ncbi:MAG: hypothetical protein OEM84_09490 [Acidimicrobiia bacterium]|nr:hypothetical protein [Acidimicrobiia bacterium]
MSGLSAYAAVSLGIRTYGAAAFAPVSVIWTFWALSTAMLAFPLQHWIIRQVRLDGHEGGVRGSLRRVAVGVIGAAAGIGAIAFIWRVPFFGETRAIWPIVVIFVALGSAGFGAVRGILAARGRFYALASALALENLLRLVAAGMVVILAGSLALFATTLVVGPLVGLGWPSVFRSRAPRLEPLRVLGFLAGVGGGTLASQVILTFGPAALALIGGQPEAVTGLFVSLALFRAPYVVAIGVAPRLTGPLAGLVAAGRRDRMRRLIVTGIGVTFVGAGFVAVFAHWVGADLIELIFGANVAPSPTALVGVGVGAVLAVGSLLLTIVIVAQGATRTILLAWALAIVVALVVLAGTSNEPLGRVVVAFVVAEVVAFAVMAVAALSHAAGSGTDGDLRPTM